MRFLKRLLVPLAIGLGITAPIVAFAAAGDATDPARNVALPCEAVAVKNMPARAAKGIVHVANVCGIVGTDVEFQSRKAADGKVHDYAFVGTMGAGPRIFDVTDPAHPRHAGGYQDAGWENDIQVRGDIAVATFDGVAGEDSTASTCLKEKGANGQGVDIYKLAFSEKTASFNVSLLTCVANPPGGAHNATLSPDGKWLAISNCCSDWAIDVVDLRNLDEGKATLRYRVIDGSKIGDKTRCPATAAFKCIEAFGPNNSGRDGQWRPHDVFFSEDAKTIYVAAINSTWIMDVSKVLSGRVRTYSVIPNIIEKGGVNNPENVFISHQADATADEKILIVSDERGGGLDETGCHTGPGGVIGGLHFFALDDIAGVPSTRHASKSNPVKLGDYFTPNPLLAPDSLAAAVAPRAERGCTIHVFRIGGNGSVSPGPIAKGFDGVSDLPARQLTSAHYGAGVWHIGFAGRPSNDDGVKEDPRTTWGNTLAWNVMPGADTWSAKEYKGNIYAGDILRGFDVYAFAKGTSSGPVAVTPPTVTVPGVAPPVAVPPLPVPLPGIP
jgi:hypothetical protein